MSVRERQVETTNDSSQPGGKAPGACQPASKARLIGAPVAELRPVGAATMFRVGQASGHKVGSDGANAKPAQRGEQAGAPGLFRIARAGAHRQRPCEASQGLACFFHHTDGWSVPVE